jgi:hypothetical protein
MSWKVGWLLCRYHGDLIGESVRCPSLRYQPTRMDIMASVKAACRSTARAGRDWARRRAPNCSASRMVISMLQRAELVERIRCGGVSREGAHVQRETVPPGEKPEPP